MLEGASIETVCHSQIRRKLVEALDVNSTTIRGHAGCQMSVGEHAYCSWKTGGRLKHRIRSFLVRFAQQMQNMCKKLEQSQQKRGVKQTVLFY